MGNPTLNRIYSILLKKYGLQGWWPLISLKRRGSVYSGRPPKNDNELFEICVGAILTQNIAWKNVETALARLKENSLIDPLKMLEFPDNDLASLIKSTGYYNQKVIKLKNFIRWYRDRGYTLKKMLKTEPLALRRDLLNIKGVGPETADSILLYGLRIKIFVVDAYTKRIFSRLGLITPSDTYADIQNLFMKKFKGDTAAYNEFHALIVSHGKDICKSKPRCAECCLEKICARAVAN